MVDLVQHIKRKIYSMGAKVEESVECSIKGLIQGNLALLERVPLLEKEVNHLHLEVDDDCFKHIALQRPVARELRFVLACMKANSDLERIGDQAMNIAQTGEILVKNRVPILPDLKEMTSEVLPMLRESLDSFIKSDFQMANSVFRRERTVNQMKNHIFKKIAAGELQGQNLETLMDFILISRNLERIGDHAQNISEYLIFMEEGKDIRHSKFADRELFYERRKT